MHNRGVMSSPRTLGVLVAACVALVGCSGDDGGAATDGGVDAAPDAGGDPSAVLFPTDRVLDVQIEMAPADFAALRNEDRPSDASRTTCRSQPTAPGYTYFPATLHVDGLTVTDVGIRKKGNLGSLSTTRPGLRVKANKYVMGQRVLGLEVLTLNNNHQDDTLISQCLGYGLFRAAGVPAPRCAFAHVTVNGEDLGIYSHVEAIRPEFLAHHFADATGNLYESGGGFAPGATGGFQPETNSTAPDCSDLDTVTTALGATDAQLEAQLGAVVDLDEFARFWAMEVVTDHWDGYANNQNNFYAYHDPSTGKFSFIPWGADALFTGRERTTRPYSVFACGALPWRLYAAPATRARYLAALRGVLDTVWDAATIRAEIDRLQALLRPYVDPGGTGSYAQRLDKVRAFVDGREAMLRAELAAGDPVWPYPAGQASCRIDLGTMTANFSTTWGTLGQFGVGSGSMTGTIAGRSVATSTVFASAGLDAEGKGAMQILGQLADGTYAVVFVIVSDPATITPGAHPVDLTNYAAIMTFYDPATMTSHGGGLLLPGTVTFSAAGTTAGATIAGSVTGHVIEL